MKTNLRRLPGVCLVLLAWALLPAAGLRAATLTPVATGLSLATDGTVQGPSTNFFTVNSNRIHEVVGVTNVQAALDLKLDAAGGTGDSLTLAETTLEGLTIFSDLTPSRALTVNAAGELTVSPVSDTELAYLDGVTSSVQTQLDNKMPDSVLLTEVHPGIQDAVTVVSGGRDRVVFVMDDDEGQEGSRGIYLYASDATLSNLGYSLTEDSDTTWEVQSADGFLVKFGDRNARTVSKQDDLTTYGAKKLSANDSTKPVNAAVTIQKASDDVAVGVGAIQMGWSTTTNVPGAKLIIPDTGGAWVSLSKPDITHFKARPSEAVDNAPFIQAAIDWSNSAEIPASHSLSTSVGILVPEGDWVIRSPIKLKKGVTLRGESVYGARIMLDWTQNGLTVGSLTHSGGTATLVCGAAHGLASGDFIVITGADQTAYNDVFKVTVVNATTLTLSPSIDSAADTTATGAIVVTKHPFLITNWVPDEENEALHAGDYYYDQNNFGLENLTVMPQLVDTNSPPPKGVWAMRFRQAVEVKLHNVRLPIHLGAVGGGNNDQMNGIWFEYVRDLDMDNVSFDQGINHVRGSTRFGGATGLSGARIRNCYFYSYSGTAVDLETSYTWRLLGCTFLNSGGAANTNVAVRVRSSATSGMLYDNFFYSGNHTHIWLEGHRVHVAGNRFHAGPLENDTTLAKRALQIDGSYNTVESSSTYGLTRFVEYGASAEGNQVENPVHEATRDVSVGGTAANPLWVRSNRGGSHAWNFAGVSPQDYLTAPLADSVESGDAFGLFVRAGSYGQADNNASTASMSLAGLFGAATPASGSGAFRVYVSYLGEIFLQYFGSTSGDYIAWRTGTNAWHHGQPHDLYVGRTAGGTWNVNLDGYPLGPLIQASAGSAPATNAAISSTHLIAGQTASSGVPWNGWISDVAVFNKNLSRGEIEQLRNGTARWSPEFRLGKDETTFNGGFESSATGWSTFNSGTITRTNSSAYAGTYSLQIDADAAGKGALTTSSGGLADVSGMVRYAVSFRAKWLGGTGNWTMTRGSGSSPVAVTIPTTGDWESISVTIGGRNPPVAGTLRLYTADDAGSILIDGMTVRRLGALAAFSAADPVIAGTVRGWDASMAGTFANATAEAFPAARYPVHLAWPVGDETTTLTAGTNKLSFRAPYAFTLTGVRASLRTASDSGAVTLDLNEAGASVFSTLLTLDQDEATSTTAATPAVLSDTAIADDALLTLDIDGAGANAAGLKLLLIGHR